MHFYRLSLGLWVLLLAVSGHAQWRLSPAESVISFTSVKNGMVAETHGFKQLSGAIDRSGNATLVVHLDSVDTAIPIRDERMRELLFATGSHPLAHFSARVAPRLLADPKAGKTALEGTLSLHGIRVRMTAELGIEPLADGRVLVYSLAPLVLQVGSHGLLAGIERLRKIAGLQAITPMIPVHFVLVFEPVDQP